MDVGPLALKSTRRDPSVTIILNGSIFENDSRINNNTLCPLDLDEFQMPAEDYRNIAICANCVLRLAVESRLGKGQSAV